MKLIKLLLFVLFICISYTLPAQNMFQRTYGGADGEDCKSLQQTADGGYIMAGVTNSFDADSQDIYVIKTDVNGDTIWTRVFGGTGFEDVSQVLQTSDAGYIIVGTSSSFGVVNANIYVVRIDANGNLLWSKIYGESITELGESVVEMPDGGFIIMGGRVDGQSHTIYLIKTDALGNVLWFKVWDNIATPLHSHCILKTNDNGLIILASLFQTHDIFLVKTDSLGNILWRKTYDATGTKTLSGRYLKQTSDGGYIIAGRAVNGIGAGSGDFCLLKTDISGNLLWLKTYGEAGDDECHSVLQTADGGYIAAGSNVIKTDSIGNLLWSKVYGGSYLRAADRTTDGGFVFAGVHYYQGAVTGDMILLKTDSNGNGGCNETNVATIVTTPSIVVGDWGISHSSVNWIDSNVATIVSRGGIVGNPCALAINDLSAKSEITMSPNPFSNELVINQTSIKGELTLIDISGKEIVRQKAFQDNTTINTSFLKPGLYIMRYNEKNKTVNFKITKY